MLYLSNVLHKIKDTVLTATYSYKIKVLSALL